MAIRDVKRKYPALVEPAQIQLQGLLREQMHRNGIGAKGIQHDQSVLSRGGTYERLARVSDDDPTSIAAFTQVGEEFRIPGNAFDRAVDLVKRPALTGCRVAGQRADAQAND